MERAYKAKILRVVDRDTVEAEHLENRKHLLEKKVYIRLKMCYNISYEYEKRIFKST